MFYTNQWVYVHIPRTGGTNVRLNAIDKFGDGLTLAFNHPLEKHNPLWSLKLSYPRKSLAIVRNPYDRYASLYIQLYDNKYIDCSFKHFVEEVSFNDSQVFKNIGYDREKIKWRLNLPQAGFISDHTVTFKLEDPKQLRVASAYMNDLNFIRTQHHANKSNDYENLYTDNLKTIVHKRFEIDFDTFGYVR